MNERNRKQARACRNAMKRKGIEETTVFRNGVNQAMRDAIRNETNTAMLRAAGQHKAVKHKADWWFDRTTGAAEFHKPEGGLTARTGKGGDAVNYRTLMLSL